jgi:hypothetical protein
LQLKLRLESLARPVFARLTARMVPCCCPTDFPLLPIEMPQQLQDEAQSTEGPVDKGVS